ncbi:MAG: beta-ketoacyl-[acyl-carrier-protein] synthase family protein [Desulfovibrio sp.]|jgi:3-oxoacyl-[acyl-carrier-protein] synthase II|nr:beta-ketoacyl-[acyl-carrier-protein] synthase family protein [Desulfovibrio sp.]
MKRVVITGMGAVSPFGNGTDVLFASLRKGLSGISRIAPSDAQDASVPHPGRFGIKFEDGRGEHDPCVTPGQRQRPLVAGLVPDIGIDSLPRTLRRSMSPMSAYAYLAALEAVDQAGITSDELKGGQTGIALGSTLGSPEALESFFRLYLAAGDISGVKSMLFFRSMSHTAAVNTAQALGVTGRVIAPCAACSSGCQAIGLAYETVAFGRQEYMLCGGTDEFHPLVTGTFDLLNAASSAYNEHPEQTPRPFDAGRDGVVCSEGAALLFLESAESAARRQVKILAEILGFASLHDSGSIAEPSSEPIAACMRAALKDAGVAAGDVAYINAHATGTELGDIAESRAIADVFGPNIPVSSLKGHLGHTMAASGALESAACVAMLRGKTILPTRNLEKIDERCAGILLPQNPVAVQGGLVVKNSFALGGINCSLVLRSRDD